MVNVLVRRGLVTGAFHQVMVSHRAHFSEPYQTLALTTTLPISGHTLPMSSHNLANEPYTSQIPGHFI